MWKLTVSPPAPPPGGPAGPGSPASPGSPGMPGLPVAPYKASHCNKQGQTQELSITRGSVVSTWLYDDKKWKPKEMHWWKPNYNGLAPIRKYLKKQFKKQFNQFNIRGMMSNLKTYGSLFSVVMYWKITLTEVWFFLWLRNERSENIFLTYCWEYGFECMGGFRSSEMFKVQCVCYPTLPDTLPPTHPPMHGVFLG